MELFKSVPTYSWLFIYFRKYSDLRKIVKNPLKKLSKRHFIKSFDVFNIQGLTVYKRRALLYI